MQVNSKLQKLLLIESDNCLVEIFIAENAAFSDTVLKLEAHHYNTAAFAFNEEINQICQKLQLSVLG